MSRIKASRLTAEAIGTDLTIEVDSVESIGNPVKRPVTGVVEEIALASRSVAIKFYGVRPIPPGWANRPDAVVGIFQDYFVIPSDSMVTERYLPEAG